MKKANRCRMVCMVAVAVLFLSACAPTLPDPSETVEKFFEGLKNYDYLALSETVYGIETPEEIEQAMGNDRVRPVLEPLYEQLSFVISQTTVENREKTATVLAEVTLPDLEKIYQQCSQQLRDELVEKAQENEEIAADEIEKLLLERVAQQIREPGDALITETIELSLAYQEDNWKISSSSQLIDLLAGNLEGSAAVSSQTDLLSTPSDIAQQ